MGYVGWSMSERACAAYAGGERPKSKWRKSDIVEAVLDLDEDGYWEEAGVGKATLHALREHFLTRSSWHHTSKCFNETDFYSIDEEAVEERDAPAPAAIRTPEREKGHVIEKGCVSYREWEVVGPRGRKGYAEHEELALIVDGRWAYTEAKRKDLTGTNILAVRRFPRAPRGTAKAFERIARRLPKAVRQ